jgi:hypothetical protein
MQARVDPIAPSCCSLTTRDICETSTLRFACSEDDVLLRC